MNFEQFLEKYQKVPVEEYPNQVTENPVVSVCVQTYQHAPFIRECLDSILMQKTDFPFEILLGEDASTDGTREICIEYAQKFPDKIRLFLHRRENNIQILDCPTGRFNTLHNFYKSRGKYIAICEGDDYWVSPSKLQDQVDFLERNREYGLIHGNCDLYYQDNKFFIKNGNKRTANNTKLKSPKDLFVKLINSEYIVRTASVVFKKALLPNNLIDAIKFPMLDTPLWLDFSQITHFRYIDKKWSVYRINQGSSSKPKSREKRLRFILAGAEMRVEYYRKYQFKITNKLARKYNNALINYKMIKSDFIPNIELIDPSIWEKLKYKYIKWIAMKYIIKLENKLMFRLGIK